jgi:hypothetical protein
VVKYPENDMIGSTASVAKAVNRDQYFNDIERAVDPVVAVRVV